MITFIDDDGMLASAESWERISDSTGIAVTMAIITNRMGLVTDVNEYMSWEDVERLSSKVFEFISHTNNHIVITEASDKDLVRDFEETKRLLDEHGCNSDLLVFPQNASDERSLRIVEKYFKASFRGANLVNVPPIDRYQITRVNLMDSSKKPLTLSAMKKWVDIAVEEGGWIVFMGHNYYDVFDSQAENNIIELCAYAKDRGVKIVHASEGAEYFFTFSDGSEPDE